MMQCAHVCLSNAWLCTRTNKSFGTGDSATAVCARLYQPGHRVARDRNSYSRTHRGCINVHLALRTCPYMRGLSEGICNLVTWSWYHYGILMKKLCRILRHFLQNMPWDEIFKTSGAAWSGSRVYRTIYVHVYLFVYASCRVWDRVNSIFPSLCCSHTADACLQILGDCEKIKCTPLPLSYSRHTRSVRALSYAVCKINHYMHMWWILI